MQPRVSPAGGPAHLSQRRGISAWMRSSWTIAILYIILATPLLPIPLLPTPVERSPWSVIVIRQSTSVPHPPAPWIPPYDGWMLREVSMPTGHLTTAPWPLLGAAKHIGITILWPSPTVCPSVPMFIRQVVSTVSGKEGLVSPPAHRGCLCLVQLTAQRGLHLLVVVLWAQRGRHLFPAISLLRALSVMLLGHVVVVFPPALSEPSKWLPTIVWPRALSGHLRESVGLLSVLTEASPWVDKAVTPAPSGRPCREVVAFPPALRGHR